MLTYSWLLIAMPLAGAAVLLLGGRRTDRWGHLLGTATVVAAFVIGLLCTFQQAGRPRGSALRPAVGDLRAVDHRRRVADPHLLDRLHGARPRPPPVLRLP